MISYRNNKFGGEGVFSFSPTTAASANTNYFRIFLAISNRPIINNWVLVMEMLMIVIVIIHILLSWSPAFQRGNRRITDFPILLNLTG